MDTLQDAVQAYLAQPGRNAKLLAQHTGMSYPTILGIVNQGKVPRSLEHREQLRQVLNISPDDWGKCLAASGRHAVPIPDSGPLSLQQLVMRELHAQGYTEQSLAKQAGVAYPTILGITRRGAIPRDDALRKIAGHLGIADEDLTHAVLTSRALRKGKGNGASDEPDLGLLIDKLRVEHGGSLGTLARVLHIGYIHLAGLVEDREPGDALDTWQPLRDLLGLSEADFARALARYTQGGDQDDELETIDDDGDEPSTDATPADAAPAPASTTLQSALLDLMRERDWTLRALAEVSTLSAVTVSRLVRQGEVPKRRDTHAKLQRLLDLDDDAYRALIAASNGGDLGSAATGAGAQDDDEAELLGLIRQLGPGQRDMLRRFLASLVG